jgi:hypothetical protein
MNTPPQVTFIFRITIYIADRFRITFQTLNTNARYQGDSDLPWVLPAEVPLSLLGDALCGKYLRTRLSQQGATKETAYISSICTPIIWRFAK